MTDIKFIPGKTKARPEAVTFKFRNFVSLTKLPQPPRSFGHDQTIGKKDWGMLGNDYAGCCVWSGAAHETMLWNKECGINVPFTDKNILSDYAAATGFDPSQTDPITGENPTDQGTDMKDAASYRRKTGIIDANGTRHQIAAYLALTPGDWQEFLTACWVFHNVGLGIEFPGSAMRQFNQGKNWTVVKSSAVEGGHYVNMVAKRRSLYCVTWGQEQGMSKGFFEKYNDEGIVYLSWDMLQNKNLTEENFDRQGLMDALKQLNG